MDIHFQGTSIAGRYAMADDCVGGWGGCRTGCPSGGGLVCVFDTLLAIVVDGGAIVILKARCLVSSMDRRPMSCRSSQFTSASSPVR